MPYSKVHVQQTVAPPGKRQPAATYLGVPAEAGGTTPRDEVWEPAHGHRNAFLVRDEEAATAGWVNPNNESGSNDARTQYLSTPLAQELKDWPWSSRGRTNRFLQANWLRNRRFGCSRLRSSFLDPRQPARIGGFGAATA